MAHRLVPSGPLRWLCAAALACLGAAASAQILPTTQSGAGALPDELLLNNPGRPWWYASKPAASPRPLGTRAPRQDEQDVVARARSLLASTPAKAIALLDGGDVVFLEYKAPAGPESVFFGASMGKTVTAMIAGQAVCGGRFSLDAKAKDLVPELRGKALGEATARDLLRMASGAADPASDSSIMTKEDVVAWWTGRLALVDLVAADSHAKAARGIFSDYRPGEQFSYKSTDPVTLGIMIHRASGRPMSAWFQSAIVDPMGGAFAGSYAQDPKLDGLADSGVRLRLQDWLRFAVWVKQSSKEPGCFGDHVRAAMKTQIANGSNAASRKTGKLFGGYGYYVWTDNAIAPDTAWALGYGGQRIGWDLKSDRIVVAFSNEETWMPEVYDLGKRWMSLR